MRLRHGKIKGGVAEVLIVHPDIDYQGRRVRHVHAVRHSKRRGRHALLWPQVTFRR